MCSGQSSRRNGRQASEPVAASALRTEDLAALRQAQRAYAESIMKLAHELRSPAAVSRSLVATLRYLNPQDAQLNDFLGRIEKRMDQLLDLVNDMLDLSQARAWHPLGQAATLDLVTATEAICRTYQEEAAAKGVAMRLTLPESSTQVRMSEKAYHLIVSNLVSNAVKYTLAGSVHVALREEGAWVVLEVQDTGIGIPPGEIHHLGTEFFRASNACESQVSGTGLGLAVVKALVESYNGELELESRKDRGSTFVVRLPLRRVNAGQPHGSRPRS